MAWQNAQQYLLLHYSLEQLATVTSNSMAYFFCDAGDATKRTCIGVVRSLIAQLVAGNAELVQLACAWVIQSGREEATSLSRLLTLFQFILKSRSTPTHIVIDAWVECTANARCGTVGDRFMYWHLAATRRPAHTRLQAQLLALIGGAFLQLDCKVERIYRDGSRRTFKETVITVGFWDNSGAKRPMPYLRPTDCKQI